MKKALSSLILICLLVGVVIAGSTFAYFQDVEASTGNTFTAGTMNITMTETQSLAFPFK